MSQAIPKFLFLCGRQFDAGSGADHITNREWVMEHLDHYASKNISSIVVLFAEQLWIGLDIDLLTFEHFMAGISDMVLLFVESWGTAAELGAFASIDSLVEKMLVYNDKKYRESNSFINNGPIKKIRDSNPHGVVFGNLDSIFESGELHDALTHLDSIRKTVKPNTSNRVEFVPFCLELLDLIGLLGPVLRKDLIEIYKSVKGFGNFDLVLPSSTSSISAAFALDFLQISSLAWESSGYLRLNTKAVRKNLCLLDLSDHEFECLRAKFMARKMRYIGSSNLPVFEERSA
ncbi:MAG: hypothetical protein HPY71_11525 [Firmicutes bacterium]|nr:hypothetical protein [Bacillota bacterium]